MYAHSDELKAQGSQEDKGRGKETVNDGVRKTAPKLHL